MKNTDKLTATKKYLEENGVSGNVEAIVILGSGLSGFTDFIENSFEIPYQNIPNFPETSVQGHDGKLIYGTIENHKVMVFSGRFHHYEGHPFATTVLPIHVAKLFSTKKIIISNAAGAVNPNFKIGNLMVINDVFRLFQKISAEPSQFFTYNLYPYAEKTKEIAAGIGLNVQNGTYLYVKGPNYETKAEIRAFQRLGIDVVGMSTAPELMEASRLNIPATAITLVTNMAAGLSSSKLVHSEVKEAANSRKDDFSKLVIELIKQL
ncbi:MAG: purine-nucleoside phosphorylase [Balneolaceae bacterium]|nr:purine-nucleoside phosphorylase [Balneolaceae bacterium]MDR9408525.1 purine-nucleoside phosphorylase [Balneolaceae bacterium]